MAVSQDNKLKDWLEENNTTSISGFDVETRNKAHRILEELSFISHDYVNHIEYQEGADKIAQQFRDAIEALPYLQDA
jgi:hypothetical protein